jgi:ketosteroid isomerase-like protein
VEEAQGQDRVAALEQRVRRLEDQVAIHRLINSWGPAVDTGNADTAAGLFSDDAILETDLSNLRGPEAISAMVLSEGHQSLVRQGSAHIPAFPVVEVDVDGDTAKAIGYSRVYLHTDEGYEVWRVSANYWEFTRAGDVWRVSRRTNHVIDGGQEAHELLSRLFQQHG